MACFSPLSAWQTDRGEIVFKLRHNIWRTLQLPCGQCIGCRLERSRQWAMRCVHESQMHEFNSFITLTYDNENVPADRSLRYDDYKKFMKRLRARVNRTHDGAVISDKSLCEGEQAGVRFYMCGEYGGENGRPHFHACLFGVYFRDRVLSKMLPSGSKLYVSDVLESLWPFGFSSVGDVTFESAAYVARYVMKKITGDAAAEHYKHVDENGEVFWREPEFTRMSLKPGIGATWFDKYKKEVFPNDQVVVRGMKMKPPRYYDVLQEAISAESMDWIKIDREVAALKHSLDNTPDRLKVREQVAHSRLAFKKRSLL